MFGLDPNVATNTVVFSILDKIKATIEPIYDVRADREMWRAYAEYDGLTVTIYHDKDGYKDNYVINNITFIKIFFLTKRFICVILNSTSVVFYYCYHSLFGFLFPTLSYTNNSKRQLCIIVRLQTKL